MADLAAGLRSSPGSLFCSLHHGLLHAVFTRPIQADFVAIGVIEIGVSPAPRHQARQLRDVKALLLKLPAKAVEIADFEVQAHPVARNGNAWSRLVQGDGAIAARRAQARMHRCALIAEVFDELE